MAFTTEIGYDGLRYVRFNDPWYAWLTSQALDLDLYHVAGFETAVLEKDLDDALRFQWQVEQSHRWGK